jgi:purine-nucleoside phosphorylase
MPFNTIDDALRYEREYEQKAREAADYIRPFLNGVPEWGIVLGSGLGDLISTIENPIVIPYSDIPNFPQCTVEGHEGKLYIGTIAGVPIIGLSGRKHYYEVAADPINTGILQAVFPVHVLAELGVKNYFATNAAGGLNMRYDIGDLMIVDSHINLHIPNPLLGRHMDFTRVDDGERVWRFQPQADEYDPAYQWMLYRASGRHEPHMWGGVYCALTGPTYEADAECRFLRISGADAVGMSTAPEVVVARNRGMRAVAMSIITNKVDKWGRNNTNHKEVKAILDSEPVRQRLYDTVSGFFGLYRQEYMKA